jgi:peptidoglycan hydrolase-like protein with peptidoglycan-binding domain
VVVAIWSVFQFVQGDARPKAATVPAVLGTTPPPKSGGAIPATATGSQVHAFALRPVAKGDRGRAVRAVQITLAALGYEVGPADGAYQQGTLAAVNSFQQDSGLRADGVAGQATVDAIVAALAARMAEDVRTVTADIDSAERTGRLTAAGARDARGALDRLAGAMRTLPVDGQATVIAALRSIAANASDIDGRRALVYTGMLDTAVRYLQSNPVPDAAATIKDADGVAYRLSNGHGFQFHPLAAFGVLNMEANQGHVDATRRLAGALLARGEQAAGGLVWEYSFPFGGPARWTSGFAQAVAATALLHASQVTHDPKIADAAAAAFRTIPRRYLHATNGGQWILEYSQSSMLILNAQMQSLILISEYARTTGDPEAKSIAAEMLTATRAALPSLDLGCWSRYSIGGNRATTDYHRYHISLLRRLATMTGDATFSEIASRWSKGLRGTC